MVETRLSSRVVGVGGGGAPLPTGRRPAAENKDYRGEGGRRRVIEGLSAPVCQNGFLHFQLSAGSGKPPVWPQRNSDGGRGLFASWVTRGFKVFSVLLSQLSGFQSSTFKLRKVPEKTSGLSSCCNNRILSQLLGEDVENSQTTMKDPLGGAKHDSKVTWQLRTERLNLQDRRIHSRKTWTSWMSEKVHVF